MPDNQPRKRKQATATGEQVPGPAQPLAPAKKADAQAQNTGNGAATSQDYAVIAKPNGREQRLQNWLLVIFTGLVFIVTGVYAYFTWGQWSAVEQSLEETRKNRELEYRAYVTPKSVIFQKNPTNPVYGDVSVVFVNTGRTPGLNGRIVSNIEDRETPVPEDAAFKPADHPPSKIVLAPQIELSTHVGYTGTDEADKLVISQLQGAQDDSNRKKPNPKPDTLPTPSFVPPAEPGARSSTKVYVYGIVTYDDIFGKQHQTKFCFFINPGSSAWNGCPTFNDFN